MKNSILKNLLGIIIALLALGMGWGFWLLLKEGVVIVFPFMLGYIYIVIGLAMLRKWAVTIFLTNITLSILICALIMVIVGLEFSIRAYLDWLLAVFTWLSMLTMTIFGILVLLRQFYKKNQ
jgi:hypothetical protein